MPIESQKCKNCNSFNSHDLLSLIKIVVLFRCHNKKKRPNFSCRYAFFLNIWTYNDIPELFGFTNYIFC